MFKQHKTKLIISSILILMPILIGLIFWNALPDSLSTHWGTDGTADAQSGKAVAVFALPFVLLSIHWLCLFITSKDPKNKNQNKKAFGLMFWIIPLISWFSSGIIYTTSLGFVVDPFVVIPIILGIMFIAIGNYMPKIRQNSTIGIKIKPTLESESNWNATHRFAGKISVIGGILLLICSFLRNIYVLILSVVIIFVIAFVPMIYSYIFRKKQMQSGNNDITARKKSKSEKYSLFIVIPILLAVAFIMFTGDLELKFNPDSFTIDATYWNELTVEYGSIDNIEYRENFDKGVRTAGWGSAKLFLGTFQNDEFGSYTLYSYTGCDNAVVLTIGKRTLVICAETPEQTKEIYQTLQEKIS